MPCRDSKKNNIYSRGEDALDTLSSPNFLNVNIGSLPNITVKKKKMLLNIVMQSPINKMLCCTIYDAKEFLEASANVLPLSS